MSVIDDYLKGVEKHQRDALERIRRVTKELVPEVEEVTTYGMPGFKYQSKYLLAFAVTKHHLSLFPTSGPIDALKDKLQDYDLSKGTIRFSVDKPIPENLLREIINFRLKQITGSH